MSGMLFIKTIRNFLSCFSNLVSGSPPLHTTVNSSMRPMRISVEAKEITSNLNFIRSFKLTP